MTRDEWSARSGRSSKWITPARRLAIYIRDSFRCCYCGRDLSSALPADVTLDHLMPQVNGKHHDSHNLVTACRRCNCARQHRPWYAYATGGAVERIKRLRRRVPNLKLARAILRGDVPRSEVLSGR